MNREEIATTQIVNGESISSLNNYEQKVIIIPPISKLNIPIFTDTLIYDIIDDKYHPYLQLSLNRKIGKQYYHIEISKSLIETKLLVRRDIHHHAICLYRLNCAHDCAQPTHQ